MFGRRRRRESSPSEQAQALPDGDELAPPLPFAWGDLSEIWTLLCLNPTGSNGSARTVIENAFVAKFGEPLTLGDVMSLFDREPNFEESFKVGDRFVLMSLDYVGEINTRVGKAQKVFVTAITRESYPNRLKFSALGVGFAAMANAAEPGDFPVVVEYVRQRTAGGNEVKKFARVDVSPADWRAGDDGPPVVVEHADPTAPVPNAGTQGVEPGF